MTKSVRAGVDLHSNNLVIGLVDQSGRSLKHQKLDCDLQQVIRFLAPYKACALAPIYSDRGSHFLYTDEAVGAVDKTRLTLGRALAQLGTEHWGIESLCHQRLDASLHENQSRARSLSGVAVLGLLSRISLALFQADCRHPQPVRDKTFPIWSGRLQERPRPMLDCQRERCLPPCARPRAKPWTS